MMLPDLKDEWRKILETIEQYRSKGRRKFLFHLLGGSDVTASDLGCFVTLESKTSKTGGIVASYIDGEQIQKIIFIHRASPTPWRKRDRESAIKYLEDNDPGEDPHL